MKVFAALVLGLAVFAVANVAGATGAGSAHACEQGRIGAMPHPTFHDGRYIVDDVEVGGLAASCAGRTVEVVLTGKAGPLLRAVGVAPAGGGTLRLLTPRDVSAKAVVGVSVAIRG